MANELEILAQVDRLFDELIAQQRGKVLELGRRLVPALSSEDVLNPDGYPELADSGPFNYEDGCLAGLVAGQMAVRARVLAPLRGDDR